MPQLLLILGVLLALVSAAQIVFVPIMASARGKSAGVWFMLVAIWLLMWSGALALSGGYAAVSLAYGFEAADGSEPAAALSGVFFFCAAVSLLPALVVWMSGSVTGREPRRSRLRSRPEATRPRARAR